MRKVYHNKTGFTLAELVLVVAIIAAVSTVAFFGVMQIKKSIRQTEMDAKAETVYNAAQNRLSELFAANNLSFLNGASTVNNRPSDWELPEYPGLNSIGSNNAALKEVLFPQNALSDELYGNNWVVEFDKTTGIVYAAFYSEDAAVTEFYKNDVPDTLRSKSGRKSFAGGSVGYYGGIAAEGGSISNYKTLDELQLTVNAVNKDILGLSIDIGNIPAECVNDGITANIAVNGQSSAKTSTIQINTTSLDAVSGDNSKRHIFVVMDSLKTGAGKQFRNIFSEFNPGENLDIDVSITLSNMNVELPKNASVTVNSLFDSISSDSSTAYISCARHLQNLDTAASGLSIGITKAEQKRSIDFSNTDEYMWANTAVYGSQYFAPVTNTQLKSFDGKGFYIKHLTAAPASGDAGMFNTFSGSAITGVRLIDTRITAPSGMNAGAVAGSTAADVNISDIRVYLDSPSGPAASNTWISGANAGGLIGKASGAVTINNSFAATVINAVSYAGGLVGYAGSSLAAGHSYADCYLSAPTGVGGIAGAAGSISLDTCYTAGYLLGNTASLDSYAPISYASSDVETSYSVFSEKPGNASSKNLVNSKEEDIEGVTGFASGKGVGRTTPYNILGDSEEDTRAAYTYPVIKTGEEAYLHHYGDWSGAKPVTVHWKYKVAYENPENGYFDPLNPIKELCPDTVIRNGGSPQYVSTIAGVPTTDNIENEFFVFNHWENEAGETITPSWNDKTAEFETLITDQEEVTYYAVFGLKKFNITWHWNSSDASYNYERDESRIDSVEYGLMPAFGDVSELDYKLYITESKRKNLYTFLFSGWTSESDGTGSNVVRVVADADYFAKYEKTKSDYSLTLVGAHVENYDYKSMTYYPQKGDMTLQDYPGSSALTCSQPGYILDGWYADAAHTIKVLNADGTIYAKVDGYTREDNAGGDLGQTEYVKSFDVSGHKKLYALWKRPKGFIYDPLHKGVVNGSYIMVNELADEAHPSKTVKAMIFKDANSLELCDIVVNYDDGKNYIDYSSVSDKSVLTATQNVYDDGFKLSNNSFGSVRYLGIRMVIKVFFVIPYIDGLYFELSNGSTVWRCNI